MPESYIEGTVTWPPVDVAGPATHRETRIGKGDENGVIVWGDWVSTNISTLTGNQPAPQTIRNYHGRKIAAEVRDRNGPLVSSSNSVEITLTDVFAPQPPGATGIVKEQLPNNYMKVTFTFAPPVDWQLVINRRIKITQITQSGENLEEHIIQAVTPENATKIVIRGIPPAGSGYIGHRIDVAFIDNHGIESSYTSNTYDLLPEAGLPFTPPAPTISGFNQVPGPEFGGPP